MEKMGPLVGSRYSDFTKSFKLAIRSLLTSCSKEEFIKAFSNFSSAEQESLHRLFVQVITSLHKMIEDEFESLSLETLVGTTLDTVDQLVEEQSLDPLFSNKTNVMDVACNLSIAKKNEIQCLTSILERAEEQNSLIQARLEQLKKRRQNPTGTADVDKLRSGTLNYWTSRDGL
ncbi:uncharacterized protein LOC110623994 isoform X2 [Manihot esculenta]|nr:uncharacterized protein LOC110623994 isoform X2 [Manihot esculenta]XP_043817135.1 uncharacterized protein LOC110623994 isoform X2 [Manihot esculenta]KAG8645491.1 hypothetical protein MANES_10G067900v8 [Manihot esculenta]KAG8645492.1 hypothetical protein MANES_10G067900v8 [Manihot esculenta]OAY39105.1 hypothetical protein MANES_10G067900v8 [Manihot esculenta]